jgi:hypothetical protein
MQCCALPPSIWCWAATVVLMKCHYTTAACHLWVAALHYSYLQDTL